MTNQVEVNDRRARYVVTNPAGQTVFQIDFPLGSATWVRVYVDGVVQTSGFTVDLTALTVTFGTLLPEGTIVTLEGLQILERENGYPLGGELRSTLINADMNFVIRSLQEMRRDIDRAVLLNKAEANATSNVMPKFIEGRAIVCGPNGIALSTANFVDLDANLVVVQEAAEAVFTIKDEIEASAEAAADAAEDAIAAAAGVSLPLLGDAYYILGVNAAGDALVYSQVTVNHIATGAVTTVKIAAAAVTPDKIASPVNAIGSIGGGTQDIDLDEGRTITATVDTSETTFTFSNFLATGNSDAFDLELTNGGSQTVNWPAAVIWEDGNAPTLTTSGTDVLVFKTRDGGTTVYGFVAGLDMS